MHPIMKHKVFQCLLSILVFPCFAYAATDAPSPVAPVLQLFVDNRIAAGVVALVANKDGVLALDLSLIHI